MENNGALMRLIFHVGRGGVYFRGVSGSQTLSVGLSLSSSSKLSVYGARTPLIIFQLNNGVMP